MCLLPKHAKSAKVRFKQSNLPKSVETMMTLLKKQIARSDRAY